MRLQCPGIIFVLGIVSLRQDSPDAADLAVSLGSLKDWTALFGPGLIVPFGNGLILGYLMYKSGLVPRRMTWFGLIGDPSFCLGASSRSSMGGLQAAPFQSSSWPQSSSGRPSWASTARYGASDATHQSLRRARLTSESEPSPHSRSLSVTSY